MTDHRAGGPAPVADMRRVLRLADAGTLGDACAEPFRLSVYEAYAIQRAQQEGALDGCTLTDLGRQLLAMLSPPAPAGQA